MKKVRGRCRPPLRSARRPGHRTATEQVRVHVPDGLPAVLTGVEDDPVAAVLDALGRGDLTGGADKLVKQAAARRGERPHVGEVIPRDHQDMRWRLRADVAEGDDPLSVQHYRRRDLSGSDPAEQAIWHSTIIMAAGGRRCRTGCQAGPLRPRGAALRGGPPPAGGPPPVPWAAPA
jgi:hypothetical protein